MWPDPLFTGWAGPVPQTLVMLGQIERYRDEVVAKLERLVGYLHGDQVEEVVVEERGGAALHSRG